jgi:hypothetical protein
VPEVDTALEELTHSDDGHAVVSLSFVPVIHKAGRIAILVPGVCERTPPEELGTAVVRTRLTTVSRRANSTDLREGKPVVCL